MKRQAAIYLSYFIQHNEQENWLCLRNCKKNIGLVLPIYVPDSSSVDLLMCRSWNFEYFVIFVMIFLVK